MKKLYLCPGNLTVKEDQVWYKSINSNKTYCEACFLKNSDKINENVFYLETGGNYHCCWKNDFVKHSVVVNNIKVSILDAKTLYRYKVKTINNSCKICIPNDTQYIIAIENCDINNTKLSIKNIMHDDVRNIVYSELGDGLIISSMSYTEDLVFDKSLNNIINITVDKWKKHYIDTSCYALDTNPVNITVQLIEDEGEAKKITNILKYYKNLHVSKKKIIVINNFI